MFDSFIDGLNEDDLGNIVLTRKSATGDYYLQLNYMLHIVWHASAESKLDKIKREVIDLKGRVLKNLKDNIKQHNQADTIVEFTSFFDMKRKISCKEGVNLLLNAKC